MITGIKRAICIVVVLLGASLGSAYAAPITAISVTGGTPITDVPLAGATDGWAFQIYETIVVTHLGYYDYAGDGLSEDHEVGIFSEGGSLLFSSNVTTIDTLGSDDFRYTGITQQELVAGVYRIGAYRATGLDAILAPADGFSSADEIEYQGGYVKGGVGLQFPDHTPASQYQPASFGPNFKFDVQAVPEPTTLALLGIGIVGLAGTEVRRRRKKNTVEKS